MFGADLRKNLKEIERLREKMLRRSIDQMINGVPKGLPKRKFFARSWNSRRMHYL